MNKAIRLAAAGVLVASLVVTAGCAVALVAGGAAAGAGAAVWYEGALRNTVGYRLDDARESASQTLRKFGDGIIQDTGDAMDRELEGRLATGEKVSIKLHAVSSTATEVTIRVGIMGDKERSHAILDDILLRLKSPRI